MMEFVEYSTFLYRLYQSRIHDFFRYHQHVWVDINQIVPELFFLKAII